MTRITKAMVQAGGWRYCCVCRALGPRVKAHWTHGGRDYCDAHKDRAEQPAQEPRS
ncbi:hypothetical protein [Burkholderia cenocepacia]|uniref:hypothetical protein n=1 Tax=Burkholderia cenocepacia TaxID=95486 RepID=UPI001C241738|nr:hypothetical protein [Burkholderia cenocepacia]MBU9656086.1 hypothetical protein [Burkholderia cenocepacia]MDS0801735.1 hypothetical protein [Burkholderia cenocepacia]